MLRKFAVVSSLALSAALGATAGELPSADAIFADPDMASVELGRLLFFDPVLSGNRNISCATCHSPRLGTSDAVSLALGEGGIGRGAGRRVDPGNPPEARVPRNAPALYNLGAREFTTLFYDGRVQAASGQPLGMRTPLGDTMTGGFKNVLAAQAMFPVTSPDEMAGHYSENDISSAARTGRVTGKDGVWDLIAGRVAGIGQYRARFDEVLGAGVPITYADIANAIADFEAFEFRADNSPFDQYLRGRDTLSNSARAGMELFYGKAGCAACHSGQFQTDQNFYAIAMPQIGPGKAAAFETHSRDTGRMLVTGKDADAYRFRTPSLRNIALTAPYGHSGAYATLEAVVRHHLDPVGALKSYDPSQAILPALQGQDDFALMRNAAEVAAIADANELVPVSLTDDEVDAILAFLNSLTDEVSQAGRLGVPEAVPSGLPLD